MGYEVSYKYHERLPDGKYDTTQTKELKKTVGKGFDELPLEKLAGTVICELARRDIWIVDVDIVEFTRKKLSFKESQDGKGIIIKGRKFSLNGGFEAAEGVEVTEHGDFDAPQHAVAARAIAAPKPQQQYPPNHLANRASNLGKAKVWMLFDPEIQNLHEARGRGLKFTVGNKYPIYAMEEHPLGLQHGQIYTTVDDAGTTMTINGKYFIPATVRLVGDDEVPGGFSEINREQEPKLSFENELKRDSHQIRRPVAPPPELSHIPVDNGQIPAAYYDIPDIRRK